MVAIVLTGCSAADPKEKSPAELSELSKKPAVSSVTNPREKSPAELSELSKNPALADDFLRFGFLAPGTVPTKLAAPTALRTFMTYSEFFEPAMPLEKAVRYVGLEPVASRTFLGIRCKGANLDVLDPRLAKWPKVFEAIEHDFGAKYTCPPTTNDPENQILCISRSFQAAPMTTVSEALANVYDVAAQITGDPVLQTAIRTDYGIDVGFAGLGLGVNGSGDSSFQFTAEHSLENAIVPEYLVRNASIAEAGCHCILVPSYSGRDQANLDPDFIWSVGTPECTTVNQLPTASAPLQ